MKYYRNSIDHYIDDVDNRINVLLSDNHSEIDIEILISSLGMIREKTNKLFDEVSLKFSKFLEKN
mgnify:FL=1|jgi:hypothetical protein|tara:strand:- start:676 stop:870 length:195 start_codon:yes stop_codon:yes gene_type:complete